MLNKYIRLRKKIEKIYLCYKDNSLCINYVLFADILSYYEIL